MATTATVVSDTPSVTENTAMPSFCLTWHAVTHRGLVRRQNEDSLCALASSENDGPRRYLFAVADGVGGHRAGFIASKIALEVVRREYREWQGGSADHLMTRAVRRANEEVFSAAYVRSEFSGMQTTMTAAVLEQDSIVVGHVGDCRLYRLRNGQIDLLTRDHTQAARLLQAHAVSSDEAKQRPERHRLTRSLGAQPFVRVDVLKEEFDKDDAYLLCSDGLWSKLPDEEIRLALQEGEPERACKELLALALKDGGTDNVSAVVFRVANTGKLPTCRPPSRFLSKMHSLTHIGLW